MAPDAVVLDSFRVATTRVIGGTFSSTSPRHFGAAIGDVGLDDDDIGSVEAAVGFVPAESVHAFAYVNDPIDHRILGEIALFFAREFAGLIDFGGTLRCPPAPRGTLIGIPYKTSTLAEVFHVGDATFLEWWLRHPDFHMVK